jgi:hypothetical protein
MNINHAIQADSNSLGNRMDALNESCTQAGCADSAPAVAERIRRMQNAIFALVCQRAPEPATVTMPEIEQIARDWLASNETAVDEAGLNGILRWVVWMAWHEGYLAT